MEEVIKGNLITIDSLKAGFRALGISSGMTVVIHSSLKSLGGWVGGGPVAVILAIEEIIGQSGTLIMPTHTSDLSDPAEWSNPPVRESWWEPIRQTMPAFSADLTPTCAMGIIPECFRKQRGVKRSNHPQVSFAAWGANADFVTANHSLEYGLSENSPLARIYDLDGWVLLLGVGYDRNTSLHLAEYRADFTNKTEAMCGAPIIVNGERSWVNFKDIDLDISDFEALGQDFEKDFGHVRKGKIAGATALFMPQKELVDYAVKWLEANRG